MDWNETTELNRKALQRIVALLLALAGLAERASGRSPAVRRCVLWLLRPAEAIARDHVAALTRDPHLAGWPMAIGLAGNGAADAVPSHRLFERSPPHSPRSWPGFARRSRPTSSSRTASQCATGVLAALFGQMPAVERRDSS